MKPAVVLPTYNEAENIRAMTEAILDVAPGITVVIVDDNSPDGTGPIADTLATEQTNVHVIHRMKNRGRGYAGAKGFAYCLEQGFDPILEMDADFSHDPGYLPKILEEAEHWDVVIGSRGVKGGGESGRGPLRTLITAGAATYLRLMLGLRGIKDPTSGFRCFRRSVMEEICPDTLTSPGPSIVTEVLFRCRRHRIKEIPIQFRDRKLGKSKFNVKAMLESLLLAARLRLRGK